MAYQIKHIWKTIKDRKKQQVRCENLIRQERIEIVRLEREALDLAGRSRYSYRTGNRVGAR